jgi:hypothetical protein
MPVLLSLKAEGYFVSTERWIEFSLQCGSEVVHCAYPLSQSMQVRLGRLARDLGSEVAALASCALVGCDFELSRAGSPLGARGVIARSRLSVLLAETERRSGGTEKGAGESGRRVDVRRSSAARTVARPVSEVEGD